MNDREMIQTAVKNAFDSTGATVVQLMVFPLYFKSKAVDGSRDEAVKFAKKYI